MRCWDGMLNERELSRGVFCYTYPLSLTTATLHLHELFVSPFMSHAVWLAALCCMGKALGVSLGSIRRQPLLQRKVVRGKSRLEHVVVGTCLSSAA